MYYKSIDTASIDTDELPWMPFSPYSDEVFIKYIKCDPVRGEVISFLKLKAGMTMPRHHHGGTVIVYTIKGSWKYIEHDWISREGGVVFETAATTHTPLALGDEGDEIITLNIVTGDLVYFDDNGVVCAMENWKTAMQRYEAFCEAKGLPMKDISSFSV